MPATPRAGAGLGLDGQELPGVVLEVVGAEDDHLAVVRQIVVACGGRVWLEGSQLVVEEGSERTSHAVDDPFEHLYASEGVH